MSGFLAIGLRKVSERRGVGASEISEPGSFNSKFTASGPCFWKTYSWRRLERRGPVVGLLRPLWVLALNLHVSGHCQKTGGLNAVRELDALLAQPRAKNGARLCQLNMSTRIRRKYFWFVVLIVSVIFNVWYLIHLDWPMAEKHIRASSGLAGLSHGKLAYPSSEASGKSSRLTSGKSSTRGTYPELQVGKWTV